MCELHGSRMLVCTSAVFLHLHVEWQPRSLERCNHLLAFAAVPEIQQHVFARYQRVDRPSTVRAEQDARMQGSPRHRLLDVTRLACRAYLQRVVQMGGRRRGNVHRVHFVVGQQVGGVRVPARNVVSLGEVFGLRGVPSLLSPQQQQQQPTRSSTCASIQQWVTINTTAQPRSASGVP